MENNTMQTLTRILNRLKKGEEITRTDYEFMRRNPDLFNLRWVKRVDKKKKTK